MTGKLGERFRVVDDYYPGSEYRFVNRVYVSDALRDKPLPTPIALTASTAPEPDISVAPHCWCPGSRPPNLQPSRCS